MITPEIAHNKELVGLATEVTRKGLEAAFEVHEMLGSSGTATTNPNQFGDVALVADVKAEEAVLDALSSLNRPIRVVSEEHGTVEINPDPSSPQKILLGVLDGLDGSSIYKKERGVGRYGTMFALFENDNPNYNQYLAAGIMEHSTRRLFLANPHTGLQVIDTVTGQVSRPNTRQTTLLDVDDSKILVDSGEVSLENSLYQYFSQNNRVFTEPFADIGIDSYRTGSSAASYAALAAGEVDVVGESTRKGNLEFATAYAIVTAAGGTMTTLDGQDIGSEKFLEFGQDTHIPILSCSNPGLTKHILDILHK